MTQRLKLEIALLILRGIKILVWHALSKMEAGPTIERQLQWFHESNAMCRLIEDRINNLT